MHFSNGIASQASAGEGASMKATLDCVLAHETSIEDLESDGDGISNGERSELDQEHCQENEEFGLADRCAHKTLVPKRSYARIDLKYYFFYLLKLKR